MDTSTLTLAPDNGATGVFKRLSFLQNVILTLHHPYAKMCTFKDKSWLLLIDGTPEPSYEIWLLHWGTCLPGTVAESPLQTRIRAWFWRCLCFISVFLSVHLVRLHFLLITFCKWSCLDSVFPNCKGYRHCTLQQHYSHITTIEIGLPIGVDFLLKFITFIFCYVSKIHFDLWV